MVNNVKIRLFRRGINSSSADSRKAKKSYTWSARFTDSITGVEGNPVAVTTLRRKIGSVDTSPIKTRDEALMICARAVELGVCFGSNYNPQFIQYCSEYWDYEKSTYIRDLLLEDPNAVSVNYCKNTQSLITTHVKKHIPESRKLQSIKCSDLEGLKRGLMKEGKLSTETIKKVLKAVNQPLVYAVKQGLIAHNPCEGITIKRVGTTTERGVYSIEQLQTLITYLGDHKTDSKKSHRLYLAVELAYRTGMRLGEIRALRKDRITFPKSDVGNSIALIEVSESWASRVGAKSTKGKRARICPIPVWLGHELLEFVEESPNKSNDFVFWGEKSDSPCGEHLLRDGLHAVLEKLKMSADEKGNTLGFHSFRHSLNSMVRQSGILTDTALRQIVGHQSEKMSDHYTHATEDSVVASGIRLNGFIDEQFERNRKDA